MCNTEAKQGGSGEFTSGTGVSSISKLPEVLYYIRHTNYHILVRDEWKVVAHEIGHNFGKF